MPSTTTQRSSSVLCLETSSTEKHVIIARKGYCYFQFFPRIHWLSNTNSCRRSAGWKSTQERKCKILHHETPIRFNFGGIFRRLSTPSLLVIISSWSSFQRESKPEMGRRPVARLEAAGAGPVCDGGDWKGRVTQDRQIYPLSQNVASSLSDALTSTLRFIQTNTGNDKEYSIP